MPSSRTHESVVRVRVAPPGLRLVQWPLRQGIWTSWLLVSTELASAALLGWAAGNSWVGVACGVALALTSWRHWLPTTYEFGPAGITESTLGRAHRIPWSMIARCEVATDGVWLLPDSPSSRAARQHGRYLRWREQRRELLETLDYYLGPKVPQTPSDGSASTQSAHAPLPPGTGG